MRDAVLRVAIGLLKDEVDVGWQFDGRLQRTIRVDGTLAALCLRLESLRAGVAPANSDATAVFAGKLLCKSVKGAIERLADRRMECGAGVLVGNELRKRSVKVEQIMSAAFPERAFCRNH